jgi:hypothetical protein
MNYPNLFMFVSNMIAPMLRTFNARFLRKPLSSFQNVRKPLSQPIFLFSLLYKFRKRLIGQSFVHSESNPRTAAVNGVAFDKTLLGAMDTRDIEHFIDHTGLGALTTFQFSV